VIRLPRALALALTGALIVTSIGCTKLVEEQPTPTPPPTPAEANKPIFTAKRTSIVETVKGLGRVAATDEATMYFKQSGRLKRIYVEIGQRVRNGDRLAELETGTLETQVAQARINYEIAQLGLQRALERANTVDPGVRSAQAAIARAEAARANAAAALEKAQAGATSADLQTADAGVAAAQASLEKAQADLARLKAPKSPDELGAARAALDKAQSALAQAQAAYDRVASRADAAGTPQAVALQLATADFQAAKARYNVANQGAKPEDVSAAEQAVQAARVALTSAEARAGQVRSGPSSADIGVARANVEAADANIATARADHEAKAIQAGLSTANWDIQIAQKQLELATSSLKTFEEQLANSQLKAPFDGLITQTNGREGDQINAYTPVVIMANPTSILVAVELNPQDLGKIQMGMPATVAVDQFKGQKFDTRVIGLPNQGAGPMPESLKRTVKVEFNPPTPVDLGALANVVITTQKKDDVVTIPNQALRRFGGRKYVQVVAENNRKREIDVETGIQTDTEVEIVKGIKEGARVVSQ
jgi:RND family efflux transporter MFP subunit